MVALVCWLLVIIAGCLAARDHVHEVDGARGGRVQLMVLPARLQVALGLVESEESKGIFDLYSQ